MWCNHMIFCKQKWYQMTIWKVIEVFFCLNCDIVKATKNGRWRTTRVLQTMDVKNEMNYSWKKYHKKMKGSLFSVCIVSSLFIYCIRTSFEGSTDRIQTIDVELILQSKWKKKNRTRTKQLNTNIDVTISNP